MCACITRRQCLAKIICRLLTWNPQFHRKKRIFLLLLQAQLRTHLKKKKSHYMNKTTCRRIKGWHTGVNGCSVI